MMAELVAKPARIFVVWEPVLVTDWSSPSTATLGRISSTRAAQFWDKDRLVSQSMGERDRRSIVWDYVAVYPRGTVWEASPPEPLYSGGPVIRVIDEARSALSKAVDGERARHIGGK
jgi:hypothetical protein